MKIIAVIILLLVFALSAFSQTPNIVWKNLQESYESFEEIKPIIVNESDKPVYVGCDIKLSIVYRHLDLLNFNEEKSIWWTMLRHGHPFDQKHEEKIMSNLKLEPHQESPLIFDEEDWLILTESDGVVGPYAFRDNPHTKGKGKYRFKIQFYIDDKKSKKLLVSESPEFEIVKEQKSYFERQLPREKVNN